MKRTIRTTERKDGRKEVTNERNTRKREETHDTNERTKRTDEKNEPKGRNV
jgi:hypothetical protein